MKVVKGNPISGGAGQPRPRPPVLTNQAMTSAGAQRIVRQPQQDQGNPHGIRRIPAGVNQNFAKITRPYGSASSNLMPRKSSASQPQSSVRAGTTAEMLAAVGEPRLPRGYNPIISGYPTRGSQRVVGGGNQPSAKGRKRL